MKLRSSNVIQRFVFALSFPSLVTSYPIQPYPTNQRRRPRTTTGGWVRCQSGTSSLKGGPLVIMSTPNNAADSTITSTTTTNNKNTCNLIVSLKDHLIVSNDDNTSTTSGAVRLILASQSPRRKEILVMMGLQGRFEVMTSPLDEEALAIQLLVRNSNNSTEATDFTTNNNYNSNNNNVHYYSGQIVTDPSDYTRILAEEKAKALAYQIQQQLESSEGESTKLHPTLVLGSDTIVVLDGKILEKPIDITDAKRMLQSLSGRSHVVMTGVALVQIVPSESSSESSSSKMELISSFTETAMVQFVKLSDSDILSYIATGEPMDKSGSYGIQGIGGQIVQSIQGDFFTVMGLPMHSTSKILADAVSKLISSV